MFLIFNSRNVRTSQYTAGRNTLGINLPQYGNRRRKAKKPATESTRAQGKTEYPNPYSPDQNVHITVIPRLTIP